MGALAEAIKRKHGTIANAMRALGLDMSLLEEDDVKINCDVSRRDARGNWLGGLVYDTDARRRGYDEGEE